MNEMIAVALVSGALTLAAGAVVVFALNLTRKVDRVATRVEQIHRVTTHADESLNGSRKRDA